jgi:Flp pilus assembly protein TadG
VTQRCESGSASVELAVLAPVLVVLLLLVVALGRLVLAHQEVAQAASDAARAASIASSPAAASAAAQSAAERDLAGHDLTCAPFSESTDVSGFGPGGAVSVHLSCTASLAGLSLLELPGSETLSASASSPIDVYRSVQGGSVSP